MHLLNQQDGVHRIRDCFGKDLSEADFSTDACNFLQTGIDVLQVSSGKCQQFGCIFGQMHNCKWELIRMFTDSTSIADSTLTRQSARFYDLLQLAAVQMQMKSEEPEKHEHVVKLLFLAHKHMLTRFFPRTHSVCVCVCVRPM